MAARANSKGYLRLSLVSCPIALYPATSESEKVRFHQLHKQTGNRIRYRKVDDETGKEVDSEDIVKAYQISKGNYIELTDEDLEAVAIESNRTIDIDQFVPIPNIKIEKEMLDLAKHIVQTKSGHFDPEKFEDRYETALRDVIKRKAAGKEITAPKPAEPSNVINLMDALKRSVAAERS